ncbi:MAG: adenylate/guanylate cyclase domain-containing protein, partial [Desulfobaccales bacterium]
VVGFSRLMGEDESATLQTLNMCHSVMESLIKQHRGRVVDAPGDAVLAEFNSVVDAVQCSVAVQKELQVRNAELPDNRRMQFRIGINLGDVIEEGEKIYGDGVNIAARLEALADPGGICISRTAFDHIETKLPLGYEFLGEKEVKNIARPVGAYRVLLEPRVTVVREAAPKAPQPHRSMSALVALGLLLLAGASLGLWKSGWFSSRPGLQLSPPTPQSPAPSPPAAAPTPPVAPAPQAVAPAPAPSSVPPPSPAPVLPEPEISQPAPATPALALAPPSPAPPSMATAPDEDFFQKLDTNRDGKVSPAEFTAWRETQFVRLDTNKDGYLSREEVAAGKTNFAQKILQGFKRIDSNRDQKLSQGEFQAGGRRRFLMFDANRDGYFSKEEVSKLVAY